MKTKPSVLVVDDNEQFRKLLCAVIGGRYDVTMASNVAQGMECVEDGGVDLVLTDMDMPSATGLDFIERLRQGGFMMPVILISGSAPEEMTGYITQHGAYSFLTKPVDFVQLLEIMEGALRLEDARRMEERAAALGQECAGGV